MNQNKTLSEIRKELGISRKAIQGYEKNNLISSNGKDRFGRRIYDEKTMEKIVEIRFYQKLGFSVKEIKELLNSDEAFIKEALAEKRTETADMIDSLSRKQLIIDYLLGSELKPGIEFMLEIIKEGD